jgi:hypothetical protein
MAQITPPWQGRDTTPANNQRIVACIGELRPGSQRNYIIATYRKEGDYHYLSHALYTGPGGRSEEQISLAYLIAWQPLEIEEPEQGELQNWP